MNNLKSYEMGQDLRKEDQKLDLKKTNHIRFRCPSCSKLYMADTASIYGEEPEFECVSCEAKFYISFKQALNMSEVVGYENTQKKEPVEVSDNLETLANKNFIKENLEKVFDEGLLKKEVEPEKETSEQVALEKMESLRVKETEEVYEGSFKELREIREDMDWSLIWGGVLENYSSRSAHQQFVNLCREKNKLDYAIECYAQILKDSPKEKMALSFLNKIFHEVETEMNLKSGDMSIESEKKSLSVMTYALLFVLVLSVSFVLIGLFNPQYRNLAGLGTGILFFTFAVRALFQ